MNDNTDPNDRVFDGLVRRAIVPKGFRPRTDAEIEAMLDGLGQDEMPEEKMHRMLGKIRGQIAMGWERNEASPLDRKCDSEEAREMAEMFRAKGEELPPDLEKKLREMEKRASEHPKQDDRNDVD